MPPCDALKRGVAGDGRAAGPHIQKETMALLPMLDDLLDEHTDRELPSSYATA